MTACFLFAVLVALISSPFSSALFDPSKEYVKIMTEDEWPSHGPWIVTVEYGVNERFIEKAKSKHLTIQREAKKRNEELSGHSFAVKNSLVDLTGVNAVVLEGLSKNDLKSMSEVVGVYPDLPVYPAAYSWGIDRIDQSTLPLSGSGTYDPAFKGCGVDIYIIDSGIDTNHIEFASVSGVSRTVSNIFNQYGAVTSDTDDDDSGHGTHCAGSAGGNTVGTAPCANIYGLKVLDGGGRGYSSYIINALNVVKERHVSNPNSKSVVSMSLGGYCGTTCDSSPLMQLISSMYDLGILFSVAAGNDYNDNACLYFPAASPKAVTVAASDQYDIFASYSNTGPCVDIIAPGSAVNSACATCIGESSYTQYSGTSMATPHVAGALALLLQKKQVSFTTAPDIVKKALICDAAKDKIQNIIPQSFGTAANLLLQVPKNDNNFGNCLQITGNWNLRLESAYLVFRFVNPVRDIRIAFAPRVSKNLGTVRYYRDEAVRVLYSSGNWRIQEEAGVLCIRDVSSSGADRRYAFFPGNGNAANFGGSNAGGEIGAQVLMAGFRWSINVENGVLVFRDKLTPGDHRFAFYQSYVDMWRP
eukprot:gene22715-30998_t